MISFNQYLVETRSAPLYHTTTTKSLFNMMAWHNVLKANPYVFFTRSLAHAKWFTGIKGDASNTVVLAFDQNKLKSRYSIKPIKMYQDDLDFPEQFKAGRNKPANLGGYDESEEVSNREIKKVMSYITTIYTNDKSVEHHVEQYNKMHGTNIKVDTL